MRKSWFLLVLLSLAIFASACGTKAVRNQWQATYCSIKGCPSGATEVVLEGEYKDLNKTDCPETQDILAYISGDVPIYDEYFLKPGTCRVSTKPS